MKTIDVFCYTYQDFHSSRIVLDWDTKTEYVIYVPYQAGTDYLKSALLALIDRDYIDQSYRACNLPELCKKMQIPCRYGKIEKARNETIQWGNPRK